MSELHLGAIRKVNSSTPAASRLVCNPDWEVLVTKLSKCRTSVECFPILKQLLGRSRYALWAPIEYDPQTGKAVKVKLEEGECGKWYGELHFLYSPSDDWCIEHYLPQFLERDLREIWERGQTVHYGPFTVGEYRGSYNGYTASLGVELRIPGVYKPSA